jgi:hypothetical protein
MGILASGEPCSRGCGNRASWFYNDQWVCDPCYRDEEFRPGHYLTGAVRHFFGTCDDCDAYAVAGMSLEKVDQWYRSGHVSQDLYEAYCHAWATGAYHYSDRQDHWRKSPSVPEVVRLVAILRGCLALRVTARPELARAWQPLPPVLGIDR